MKKILLVLLMLTATSTAIAQPLQPAWGDQGNGTYINPILNADYSDPDVTRVGDKYYMVCSDFHWLGMQVMESTDLVNWSYCSQIFRRLDLPEWDTNGHYAGGSWAPAIRYHNGRFYVYFCTPDEGLFMTSAVDPHGPWEPLHCVKAIEKWEDPCPLWDDDGQAYLGRSRHRAGPIIVHRMSPDGRELLDDGVTVYTGPVAEGTKFLKRNGWYYLIIPEGGVGEGWQTVLRSRHIYGPYEKRVVLEQGSTTVNGPHQGALVDTPDGQEWWFFHFQSTPVLGRVVHLQPARWQDDWPLIGVDIDGNGIGEPVAVWTKPALTSGTPTLPQTSDEFDGPALGLQWQWCHNPVDSAWSIDERRGRLTLQALPAENMKESRCLLSQKVMGYESEATTLLYCRDLKATDRAGLLLCGKKFSGIGVSAEGIYMEHDGEVTLLHKGRFDRVWLRANMDATNNAHLFSYSTDGKRYTTIEKPFQSGSGYWKGLRIGLYCYSAGKDGGTAQFDFFRYTIRH